MAKKHLIAIIGPTGIGKTRMAIKVAEHFKTSIISADSRQFYKEMTIGTAVPSPDELRAAPHYFIQHKSILETYSVGDFEKEALATMQSLFKKNNIIVLVGGSGLYIDAVLYGLDEFPSVAPEIRKQLNETFEKEGIQELRYMLKEEDKTYYDKVDIENPHRMIRALEICLGTGKPYSSFLDRKTKTRPFKTYTIGLTAARNTIYGRINSRVDLMLEHGLVEEAHKLLPFKHLNALQTVGYKELFDYFEGKGSLDFAISEIKKNTRRFAKRQGTWFRKKEHIAWVDHDIPIDEILQKIDKHGYIL